MASRVGNRYPIFGGMIFSCSVGESRVCFAHHEDGAIFGKGNANRAKLSGEQIILYCEKGHLTVHDALDLGMLERLCAIIDEWPDASPDVKESDGLFDLKDSQRRGDPYVRCFKRVVRNHLELDALV
jgi:hypothetical protein